MIKKIALCWSMNLLICLSFAGQAQESILLINGNIITLDEANTIASDVLIENGRFSRVGDINPDRYPGIEVIDLAGRTVIPGLIDSHMHFVRATLRPGYDMRGVEMTRSMDALIGAIEQHALDVPVGAFITIVGGWDPIQFMGENRFPTLQELDTVTQRHPFYMHLRANGPAVTNSIGKAFFESHDIPVADDGMIAGGRGQNPSIAAWDLLKSLQTEDDKRRSTQTLMTHANSLGLTMIIDAAGTNRPGAQLFESHKDYDTLRDLWREKKTSLRVRMMYMSWDDNVGDGSGDSELEQRVRNSTMGLGDDMLRVAALGEHLVTDNKGEPFVAATALAASKGWSLQQHSSTLEENAAHIAAFEAAHGQSPISDLRWSLTHVHQITEEIVDRLMALNAGVTVQDHRYLNRGNVEGDQAGPPYRMLVDKGIATGAGTDSTNAQPMNPWYSIYYMVTGKNVIGRPINADQKISRLEALRLYTWGSAWFGFDEDKLGSIEPGKLADLAVLSDHYLSIPEDDILDLSSMLTIVGGERVYPVAK